MDDCIRCNKLLNIIEGKLPSCDRCEGNNQVIVFCCQCDGGEGAFLCEVCNAHHCRQYSEHRVAQLNIQPSSVIRKPWKMKEIANSRGEPWGVAVSKTNSLWGVADNTNHCVHVFDSSCDDQLVKTFGSRVGSEIDEFNSPEGVAFDDNNCLYVADCLNHRVQRIDLTSNTFLHHFGNKGNGNGQLDSPHGITTHNDRLYVADTENGRISVFCISSKTFYSTFGEQQLGKPHGIAVNNQAQLLVVDYKNHCVYIFTPQGDLVKKIGTESPGSEKGQLSYAYGIAVDLNGFIYVADSINHRVSVFDSDGNTTECFGSRGSDSGYFNMPCGIAVRGDMVYVSDRYNKRIQIFKQSGHDWYYSQSGHDWYYSQSGHDCQSDHDWYYSLLLICILVCSYYMEDICTWYTS